MDYSKYFAQKTRDDKTVCVYLKEDAPQPLSFIVRSIHIELGAGLPNDWIYSTILEALESDEPDLREAWIEPDIYNTDLIEWTRNSFALEILNEALEHCEPFKDYIKLLQWAQYEAIRKIYDMVADFLDEHKEEAE